MSGKTTRIPKRLSTIFLAVLTAAVIVIVFGYESFSRNPTAGPSVTEFQKETAIGAQAKATDAGNTGPGILGENAPAAAGNDLAKVVLNVQGLSCSSCIREIKSALSTLSGIEQVIVDISRGAAQVYFNPNRLKDVQQVAEAITARGYPAAVVKTYSAAEIQRQEEVAEARARSYIASVGGWDIARADFNTELAHAQRRYQKIYGDDVVTGAKGESLVNSLRAQIAARLVDEGVMMQEITRAGFALRAEAVETELQRITRQSGEDPAAFERTLRENGITLDYFKKRLETKLLIGQYMDQVVFADASTDADRQRLFTAWFTNAKILAEVVYYDKELEELVQAQSARGSCGG